MLLVATFSTSVFAQEPQQQTQFFGSDTVAVSVVAFCPDGRFLSNCQAVTLKVDDYAGTYVLPDADFSNRPETIWATYYAEFTDVPRGKGTLTIHGYRKSCDFAIDTNETDLPFGDRKTVTEKCVM